MNEEGSPRPANQTVGQLLAEIEHHFHALDVLIADLSVKAGDKERAEKHFTSLVDPVQEMMGWSQQLQTGQVIDAKGIVRRDELVTRLKKLIDDDP